MWEIASELAITRAAGRLYCAVGTALLLLCVTTFVAILSHTVSGPLPLLSLIR